MWISLASECEVTYTDLTVVPEAASTSVTTASSSFPFRNTRTPLPWVPTSLLSRVPFWREFVECSSNSSDETVTVLLALSDFLIDLPSDDRELIIQAAPKVTDAAKTTSSRVRLRAQCQSLTLRAFGL